MKLGFWKNLKKPIVGLAPMDGVTDQPFRYVTKKHGNPDVIYTEFATVEGFCRKVKQPLFDFLYDETQRPIVAQIYGKTPQFFYQTAIAVCQLGFDGVDINMGCPAKSVANGGAGAGLIKTPELAQEIIVATQKGVENWQNGKTVRDCPDLSNFICNVIEERHEKLPKEYQDKNREIPVSVKTRIGFDQPIVEEWIPALLEKNPAVIALHGRTLRKGYAGKADWEQIALAAKIIHRHNPKIIVLGNGDIPDKEAAIKASKKYGVDGVLIGRTSFGNPWVFSDRKETDEPITIAQKAALALEHSLAFEKAYGDKENYRFLAMRKHLAWYIKGVPNASDVRSELVRTDNSGQVKAILEKYKLFDV